LAGIGDALGNRLIEKGFDRVSLVLNIFWIEIIFSFFYTGLSSLGAVFDFEEGFWAIQDVDEGHMPCKY
jgi:hypothetical protein